MNTNFLTHFTKYTLSNSITWYPTKITRDHLWVNQFTNYININNSLEFFITMNYRNMFQAYSLFSIFGFDSGVDLRLCYLTLWLTELLNFFLDIIPVWKFNLQTTGIYILEKKFCLVFKNIVEHKYWY